MLRSQQKLLGLALALALLTALGGCSFLATVEVKPSDCINPSVGDCTGATNESRILGVRLYQLKQSVDPCQLDLESFARGKDLEVLKSALVEAPNKEPMVWSFNVAANEPRNQGTWRILRETEFVLAVALGRGKGRNSARLIPIDRLEGGWQFPALYFRGYDICLNKPCRDRGGEAQCR